MAIYLKLLRQPESLRELFKELFSSIGACGDVYNVTTYRDEKCTILQCRKDKLRSFDEVLEIAQTYFPQTDEKEVFKILLTLDIRNKNGESCDLIMINCCYIGRITLCYGPDILDEDDYDTALDLDKFNSRWSWRDLTRSIGIENFKKFLEFQKVKQ